MTRQDERTRSPTIRRFQLSRQVSFNNQVCVREHLHRGDMSISEIQSTWYSSQDINRRKKKLKKTKLRSISPYPFCYDPRQAHETHSFQKRFQRLISRVSAGSSAQQEFYTNGRRQVHRPAGLPSTNSTRASSHASVAANHSLKGIRRLPVRYGNIIDPLRSATQVKVNVKSRYRRTHFIQ